MFLPLNFNDYMKSTYEFKERAANLFWWGGLIKSKSKKKKEIRIHTKILNMYIERSLRDICFRIITTISLFKEMCVLKKLTSMLFTLTFLCLLVILQREQ